MAIIVTDSQESRPHSDGTRNWPPPASDDDRQ